MLWYTTRLISVLTNVMEYVHLTSHHLRQRKPPVLMTLISAIGTGGLVCAPGGARFLRVRVPNPPGSGKDIAEGKGVHREVESEGSRMWGTY